MTSTEYLKRALEFGSLPDIHRDDRVVARALATYWWEDPKAEDHTIAVSRETWQEMERTLAFLESDLVLQEAPDKRVPVCEPFDTAIFLLASIALVLIDCATLQGLWMIFAAWVGVGIVGIAVRGFVPATTREGTWAGAVIPPLR